MCSPTEILEFMRGDSRPQLIHRIDTLLDLLARVPGACGALAAPGTGRRQGLPIKNARSAKICASSSKRQAVSLTEEEESKAPRFARC